MFGVSPNAKIIHDYCVTEKRLGKGSSATVYLGYHKNTKKSVAVKKFELTDTDKRIERRAYREIQILHMLDNPHIIKLYDYFHDTDNNNIYLFLEYCEKGCLRNFLGRGGYLEERYVKKLMTQVKDGIEYLIQKNIFHRDIKPGNILLTKKYDIKIADFGLATYNISGAFYRLCGSPLYMAPEILISSEYTKYSDIWSLGLVLFEMFYGYHPFRNIKDIINLIEFYKSDIKVKIPPIIKPNDVKISENGKDLLRKMILKNDRITWDDFFNHPWFKNNKESKIKEKRKRKTENSNISDNNSVENTLVTDSKTAISNEPIEKSDIDDLALVLRNYDIIDHDNIINTDDIDYNMEEIQHYRDTYTGENEESLDLQHRCSFSSNDEDLSMENIPMINYTPPVLFCYDDHVNLLSRTL